MVGEPSGVAPMLRRTPVKVMASQVSLRERSLALYAHITRADSPIAGAARHTMTARGPARVERLVADDQAAD